MTGEMAIGGRALLANSVVAQTPPDDPGCNDAGDATGVTAPVASFQAWLASVDVEALSDRERVDLVGALERVKGSASATQARATHALRCSRERVSPQDVARSVGAEVALARRESPTSGDRFVGLSRALVTELPETMKALTAGGIGERHAVEVVQQSVTLSVEDRAELDGRLGPVLGRLGVRGVGNAARRVAAELDAAAVVRRMEAAARSRRVTVRPAPDGMAYLTVLAPMPEVVGAYASLKARASAVVGGQCPEERPDDHGTGAVMADTATRLLSGRAPGQVHPVEVHLVMTDRALMGTGDPARSVFESARVPGHGSVPAPVARAWLGPGLDASSTEVVGADAARVWVRGSTPHPTGVTWWRWTPAAGCSAACCAGCWCFVTTSAALRGARRPSPTPTTRFPLATEAPRPSPLATESAPAATWARRRRAGSAGCSSPMLARARRGAGCSR